eukprot:7153508-Alexandrium_andersonii.AAC.1
MGPSLPTLFRSIVRIGLAGVRFSKTALLSKRGCSRIVPSDGSRNSGICWPFRMPCRCPSSALRGSRRCLRGLGPLPLGWT